MKFPLKRFEDFAGLTDLVFYPMLGVLIVVNWFNPEASWEIGLLCLGLISIRAGALTIRAFIVGLNEGSSGPLSREPTNAPRQKTRDLLGIAAALLRGDSLNLSEWGVLGFFLGALLTLLGFCVRRVIPF